MTNFQRFIVVSVVQMKSYLLKEFPILCEDDVVSITEIRQGYFRGKSPRQVFVDAAILCEYK